VSTVAPAELAAAMRRWGVLEEPPPQAALRWIEAFIDAYGATLESVDAAQPLVEALRAEGCIIPALELERLR
jgi:hypothetical protein